MTNNQLQLNNDKTEMILTATKMLLNSDSVPQSINLEGSDIKFANTVCVRACVHACMCESVCVHVCMCSFMLYTLNFKNICICKERVST